MSSRVPARLLVLAVALAAGRGLAGPPTAGPEDRALAYLAREVPGWPRANHCFSCHNNGDAARALYDAVRRRRPVPPEALRETNGWLSEPERWDRNGGDGPFRDHRLARVQFSAALAAAVEARQIQGRGPLERAAQRLAGDQQADGSWPLEGNNAVGSPATYGRPWLTLSARDVLRAAGPERYRAAIARANRWLLRQRPSTIPDASAILLATVPNRPPGSPEPRQSCLTLLRLGQSTEGGWGPYADAPPEPFDTALALLALARLDHPPPDLPAMIARGRVFLIASQNPDGSWTETTRPAGGESYAQRLSTTGWATLALLATEHAGR